MKQFICSIGTNDFYLTHRASGLSIERFEDNRYIGFISIKEIDNNQWYLLHTNVIERYKTAYELIKNTLLLV